jgi:hypothetical protein
VGGSGGRLLLHWRRRDGVSVLKFRVIFRPSELHRCSWSHVVSSGFCLRFVLPACRNCVTSPFAYAQLSHVPVTGSTMKQVGHTFGGSSSLACAFLTLVCG